MVNTDKNHTTLPQVRNAEEKKIIINKSQAKGSVKQSIWVVVHLCKLFNTHFITRIQAPLSFKNYSTMKTKNTNTTRQPAQKQKIFTVHDKYN